VLPLECENRPSLMGCRLALEIGVRRRGPCSEKPPIFNDIAEVIMLMASFSQVAVLSYPPSRVIVSQMVTIASRDVASL
jgi:hypothetical protein